MEVWSHPGGSDSKESAGNAGDQGIIPGSGESFGEGNGYPLHYSCLENPMGYRMTEDMSNSGWGAEPSLEMSNTLV